MAIRVLLVDDESSIRRVLTVTFKAAGFTVVESARGEEIVTLLGLSRFDVIVLDMNMPGMSGLAVCRAVRKTDREIPILMLTVRDSEDDKVGALDAGADDYVTKPFAMRELVARVKALVRRSGQQTLAAANVSVGDVTLCGAERTFTKRGNVVNLTKTQFDIVELLMLNAGQTLSHKKILGEVWGPEYRTHFEYLRTYMHQIRRLIEDDPTNPAYLITVPYVGYRFRSGEKNAMFDGESKKGPQPAAEQAAMLELIAVSCGCDDGMIGTCPIPSHRGFNYGNVPLGLA